MTETCRSPSGPSSSMWQSAAQYSVPPQRLYEQPAYVHLYPHCAQPQAGPSSVCPYSYYSHPPVARQQQQQQQQQPQAPRQPVASASDAPDRPASPGFDASNPRASRNAAEKHRRDNLNNQIQAMASLVPAVASGGSRKRDKISILRLAANYLRMNYTLGRPSGEFLPARFNDIDLEDRLIDNLAGSSNFLMVLTTVGKIIYVSRHVERHLGHEQTDLMGESLFNYVYEDDKDELRRYLTPDTSCLPALPSGSDSLEDSSNSSSDDSASYQPDYRQFRPQRRLFNVRMSVRTNSRREALHYEYIQVSGVLRLACERQQQEQAKPRKACSPNSNDVIFIGTAKLLQRKSVSELPYLVHNRNEYFTRHLIDGRIIFCDHRISIVAGYMAREVSGTSAFKFMHKDDVRWTIVALRHMYDHGNPYGSSCYRLIAKTGHYIYLRTHGYLEIDEETKTVTSFICINTLTSQEEGEELIAEMKKRFSATINHPRAIQGNDSGFDSDTECTSSRSIATAMDEPEQLEQAISELVSDLPATVHTEEPCPDSQYVKAMVYSHKLPPPSVQASQVGINDVDNFYFGKAGKGAKGKSAAVQAEGKQSPSASTSGDSPSDYSGRNGQRVGAVAEKRIPEPDNAPSSPLVGAKHADAPAKEVFVSPNSSESADAYPESVALDDDLATNAPPPSVSYHLQPDISTAYIQPAVSYLTHTQQQVSLKRPYEEEQEQVSVKKIATDNCVTLELVNVDDFVNGDIAFPAYIQVQSTSLADDLQQVPATFQQIDTDSITLASTEGSYIEFPADLDSSIQNNPEVMKLLKNLPQTVTLEGKGTLGDLNLQCETWW